MFLNLSQMASIDDLRHAARHRIPRFAFDFIDGGAESETGLQANRADLDAVRLVPCYLRDVSDIRTGIELFGRDYAVPFGAAPVGFLNMAWPGTDLALAKLAARRRMAFSVSTAASTPLETLAEAGNGYGWFQFYMTHDQAMADSLLERVEAAAYDVLVVTVDVCQPGKRDRDIRNGLQVPFRLTPRICLDLALHPGWALGTLTAGAPGFANMQGNGFSSLSLTEIQSRILSGRMTWDDLERLRDRWPKTLLLKGILHPADAERAVETGCDGIIVSNHGGRQADYAPSAIAALPGIAAAVDGRAVIILDSGVRRGADAVRARALGAAAVFAGRAFAYGAAAGGTAGLERAFDILETELRFTLGQIGQPVFTEVGREVLAEPA